MGVGVCLRWPFPPACQGKSNHETCRALAMPFSLCLSRKSQSWDLLCACDDLFPLPVEEKASRALAGGVPKHACDSLSPLPVEEKAIMGTWRALAIPFPLCLSRKRQSWEHGVRLRWAFPLCLCSCCCSFCSCFCCTQLGLARHWTLDAYYSLNK